MIVLIKKFCVIQVANFQVEKIETRTMIAVEIFRKFSFYYTSTVRVFPLALFIYKLVTDRIRFDITVV